MDCGGAIEVWQRMGDVDSRHALPPSMDRGLTAIEHVAASAMQREANG